VTPSFRINALAKWNPDATSEYMAGAIKGADFSSANFHGSMSDKIKFDELKINNTSLKHLLELSPEEPISFKISGESKRDINDAEIFISIFSDGFELANLFDSDKQCTMKKGRFVSEFQIPAYTLIPGKYSFKVGSQSPRLKEWQLSDYIGTFEIAPQWSEKIKERNRGPLNIHVSGTHRSQLATENEE